MKRPLPGRALQYTAVSDVCMYIYQRLRTQIDPFLPTAKDGHTCKKCKKGTRMRRPWPHQERPGGGSPLAFTESEAHFLCRWEALDLFLLFGSCVLAPTRNKTDNRARRFCHLIKAHGFHLDPELANWALGGLIRLKPTYHKRSGLVSLASQR